MQRSGDVQPEDCDTEIRRCATRGLCRGLCSNQNGRNCNDLRELTCPLTAAITGIGNRCNGSRKPA